MSRMNIWTTIAENIAVITGDSATVGEQQPVGGGCINQAYRLMLGDRPYFVKLNDVSRAAMFEAEARGLQDMAAAGAIRLPRPIAWGTAAGSAYIALEWIDLGGRGERAWFAMGQQLAQMHRWRPSGQRRKFGWHRDNTLGSTPQINGWCDRWTEFWIERRLRFQLDLARRNGGSFPLTDRLLAAVPDLLGDREVQPSILHGDLWSGNGAIAADGTPVIFDPATYWGDRETDLAMTELFGGFPEYFYRGYVDVWPLDDGYSDRKLLYNLYHVLNHFNLFGGGYGPQAQSMMARLLD